MARSRFLVASMIGALVLMRGETFIETIEEDAIAVIVVFRGTATVTRQRAGAQVGLHITPRCGEPVFLTSPGSYCVAAKDHVPAPVRHCSAAACPLSSTLCTAATLNCPLKVAASGSASQIIVLRSAFAVLTPPKF